MSTTTVEQRAAALDIANRARIAISEERRRIAAGELDVATVLEEGRSSITVSALLLAQPRWGPIRTRTLLRGLEIRELRRVRELTERQRRAMLEALR